VKAVVWHGPRDVRVADDVEEPELLTPRDAIVRVTCAAICGTDLHPYRGELDGFRSGTILGHEFCGVVERVGEGCGALQPGDRVFASDVIACGRCTACERGMHYQCDERTLFGYGEVAGPYVPGGQAELVRVPFADVVLCRIPDGLSDEQAVFAADVLSTGFTAAERADVRAGQTVAVVGCGPVGLCAVMSARLMGAAQVLAIDPERSRRDAARALGATPVAGRDGIADRRAEWSDGQEVDAVIEAVGADAALTDALAVVRPRGTVVVVGSHGSTGFSLSTVDAFDRELTLRFAVGDPIAVRDRLVALLSAGRLDPAVLISHRLPLDDAVDAYRAFDRREATKVLLLPGDGAHAPTTKEDDGAP